ncbi:hypothetical protein FACS189419_06920 [Planctomycetales bacterium]|nr:hypothetical protein FACS189419_06920 [Planctomycetales bacterium]
MKHIEYRCALAAEAVYHPMCDRKPVEKMGLPYARDSQVVNVFGSMDLYLTGSHRKQLFYDNRSKKYILAFDSTHLTDVADLIQNAAQFSTGQSEYYQQGIALVQSIRPEYREKVILTGHSLGGGIASVAACAAPVRAIVFNPPAIHQNLLNNFDSSAEENITRFVVAGELLDIVNDVTNGGIRCAIGQRISIEGKYQLSPMDIASIIPVIMNPNLLLALALPLTLLINRSLKLHTMQQVLIGLKKHLAGKETKQIEASE